MSARIVLHIGASKTGSSAIQTFLRRNYIALAELGYAVLDKALGLTDAITGEHVWAVQERITARDKDGLTARLAAAADFAGPGKTLIVSAENLSNIGNHEFVGGLSKTHDVRVILYIRRQDDLLTSAWQQWHCKVESDMHAWLLKAVNQYGLWDRLTRDWEGVVKEGNLSVRIFERTSLIDGDLLKDFVDALGLRTQASALDFDIGIVNPSLTDIVTPLVAGNTRMFKDANDNDFFNFLLRVGKESFVAKQKISLISRDQRESILWHYKDTNQRVCAKYFIGRPQLFSSINHAQYVYPDPDRLRNMQLQFLTELIFNAYRELEKHK